MQINEIMTSAPITVRETASIGQAWGVLQELDVRHLPVVNADRELVGIVSDRDFATPPAPPLTAELLGNQSASPDAAVSTIMTGAPISVEPDDDLGDAIDLMVENKVGAIPVVGPEGQVVGIVSYLDVLRSLRAEMEPAEDQV
jgi:acetoin utilization protein AcuB